MKENLGGKKILLVGLGRLGGGVATAKFFASRCKKLIISDSLSEKELEKSINKLKKFKNIVYSLGGQKEKDFDGIDIVIFNQAVPEKSKWVKYAKKVSKNVFSDLTFFLDWIENNKPKQNFIAVTGTRGKTTTATWISHFIPGSILGGNIPNEGLYSVIEKIRKSKETKPIVLELSSFQLEYLKSENKSPKIAVITNLYQDHLNRHGTMSEYLRVKGLIFKNQTENDFLILNNDNIYTRKFLSKKPKSKIYLISRKFTKQNGLYVENSNIVLFEKNKKNIIGKIPNGYSSHMQYNLLSSILSAYLFGVNWDYILKKMRSLPQIPFRQEKIYKSKSIEIYNDSASTSPEGSCAAIDRFSGNKSVFIFGGTDKLLDFRPLAKSIAKNVKKSNSYFLEGSGTMKLLRELKKFGFDNIVVYKSLDEIVRDIFVRKSGFKRVIFSPGAASFEKFKNEFDRGEQFNKIVRKFI